MLERTLGVPIFQEQVMQLAIVAAGFTPGEADRLRRSMAAWKRKGGLQVFEQRLVEGMRERGYDEAFATPDLPADSGLRRIRLPRVPLGVVRAARLRSSWLKHYEPAAFCAALLNTQPMGFYAPAQLVARCAPARRRCAPSRRHGERAGLHARGKLGSEPGMGSEQDCTSVGRKSIELSDAEILRL